MKASTWRGFRSVLCAVDFSETSALALQYAALVAERGHAPLTVTYANDPLLVAAASAALHIRDIARRSERELRQFVDATVSEAAANHLSIACDVTVGAPADRILYTARRKRADLIVVGTAGLTGADRLILGSTARAVLQQAPIPVLAVPHMSAPAGPRRSWPGDRILAAIDLNGGAASDITLAAAVAKWFGSSPLLVHVVPELVAPAWLRADVGPQHADAVMAARERLETLASRLAPAADARVVAGRVDEEIGAIAAAEQIGLILAVLRGRRGWLGSRRGSITYQLLAGAVTPVLAFPSERRRR